MGKKKIEDFHVTCDAWSFFYHYNLAEYRKYQVKTLSPVEQTYLDSIKMLGKKGKINMGDNKTQE